MFLPLALEYTVYSYTESKFTTTLLRCSQLPGAWSIKIIVTLTATMLLFCQDVVLTTIVFPDLYYYTWLHVVTLISALNSI